MAKLTVTKDEICVSLSEQEIEKILTEHVTGWLNRNLNEYCHESVELKDHIETNIQQPGRHGSERSVQAEISFQRNEITDEEHDVDIMD